MTDKNTNDSLKRSLFFSFDNGKLHQIVDSDFGFDVNYLLPGSTVPTTVSADSLTSIKELFGPSFTIGGGSGLTKLTPFILGNGGIYTDNNNPYLNALPSEADIDNLIATASAQQLRDIVVYAVRSKVDCKQIGSFLGTFLGKVRAKIAAFRLDFDTAKKEIANYQVQIASLQGQISDANLSQLGTQDIQKKILSVQADIANLQQTKTWL